MTSKEIVIDLFAGAGGASTGIAQAIGCSVDAAVDINPAALRMHHANHRGADLQTLKPQDVAQGQPVGLLWASPPCTSFSRARGGKPVDEASQALAWIPIEWARKLRPRVIIVENVPEFRRWAKFEDWRLAFMGLGYKTIAQTLSGIDYGAGTSRKRLFVVAHQDGAPTCPPTTHAIRGTYNMPVWRTAADCIDASSYGESIFARRAPLAEKTFARVARGLCQYVLDDSRGSAFIDQANGVNYAGCGRPIDAPLSTITVTGTQQRLVSLHLIKYYGVAGTAGQSIGDPLHTITTVARFGLVAGNFISSDPTLSQEQVDGAARCSNFFHKYRPGKFKDPSAWIIVADRNGMPMVLVDICLRMLTPRELFRAQGFPEDYIIDGIGLTKAEQIACCGNSVCPPVARALVSANYRP